MAEVFADKVLKRELGLADLVLAQVLCVVGSSWVGIAAKLGKAHAFFWLLAIALFYLPLGVVVIYLNRLMPLEGGLYQWAKAGFGEMAGFLTAWNLWVYAVIVMGAIVFVVPTDIGYMLGARGAWIPASKPATLALTGGVVAAIALVAARGLDLAKWLHNIGSVLMLLGYAILLTLPLWAVWTGRLGSYEPLAWQAPEMSWFTLAIFGQMCVGALSGFEYVAILAGECRSAVRTIGGSVAISAPIIAVMFIFGTSSVLAFVGNQPINVIGPIPQTIRLAVGTTGRAATAAPFAIFLIMARNIAAASLIFTGLTRLPMTAGWDRRVPRWFAELHPRRRTPVNSILFMAALATGLILLSMLGVREQEASQTLQEASVAHYAIAYVGLFALPLVGRAAFRRQLPLWVRITSAAGLVSSLVSLFIAVYPVVDVVSRSAFAAKICSVVAVSNGIGILIYRASSRPTSTT
ncbi:MAG TPA: APC family permease [Bryobacteraceae bacterium]|nr:APC family permease [Bryobacteraceae bacterium]